MTSFTIHYSFSEPVKVNDFSRIEIILTNNGITDFFDGAIYMWQLYIVDGNGKSYYFDEVYDPDKAEEYRNQILSAINSGKKDISPYEFKMHSWQNK